MLLAEAPVLATEPAAATVTETGPPALAFANAVSKSDAPSIAYATVYPLTMLLRIVSVQILVLVFCR